MKHWRILLGMGVFGGGLFLLYKALGGVPFVTSIFHRERADGVDPRLQSFLDWWQANGPFPVKVLSGVRTNAQQAMLYAQGRTIPGPHAGEPGYPALGQTVTNASSVSNTAHGHGGAYDLAPVIGGLTVDDASVPSTKAKFDQLGQLAESQGFVWGGRFPFYDGGHIEVADWASLPIIGAGSPSLADLSNLVCSDSSVA